MPKTRSKMTLSERREAAYTLFAKGFTNKAVAESLKVNKDTVKGYRDRYEASIQAQAQANPAFLRDVVANTFRSLHELDKIREDAWKHMERRKEKREFEVECPECGEGFIFTTKLDYEIPDQTRVQYQNVLLKAQDQRAKLFGIMGVKQEIMVAMMQVKAVQDRLLHFMAEHLCAADRAELEDFLQSPEIAQYMSAGSPASQVALAEFSEGDDEIVDAEIVE